MARRKKRRSGGKSSWRAKFGKVARHCKSLERAGKLPSRGQFGKCMRKGLKGR